MAVGLFKAFAGSANRKCVWKTGMRDMIDPAYLKYYKHIKLRYKGRPTLACYVDGVRVLNKVLGYAAVATEIDIDFPHVTAGKHIQYRFSGDFELYYLEEVVDLNKR